MKRLIQLVVITLISTITLNAQDTLFQKNGKIVPCKIKSEDSTAVTFFMKRDGRKMLTFLNKSDIESIKYGSTQSNETLTLDKISLGIGMGLDYGGIIGGNLTVYPHRNIGLFGGVGYALTGMGYNIGTKIRFIKENSESVVHPYITGMYGYNAVIKVKDASEFDKIFYGPTLGFGFDFHSSDKGYFSIALLIPIRSSEVNDYIDDLKNKHGVEFKNNLLPIAISLGYKIVLN